MDKIERQIRKNKTKIEKKNRIKSGAGKLFTDRVVEKQQPQKKLFAQNN